MERHVSLLCDRRSILGDTIFCIFFDNEPEIKLKEENKLFLSFYVFVDLSEKGLSFSVRIKFLYSTNHNKVVHS